MKDIWNRPWIWEWLSIGGLGKVATQDGVLESIRHTLNDRLRAVQCPSDMIDQIGGWSTAGVGQSYGEGYSLNRTHQYLTHTT